MLKRSYNLLLLLITAWTSSHAAQTGRVDYPYLGIQFTIPQEWQGQEDGEGFLMGSKTVPGLLGVLLNDATSPEDLRREADKGIVDETIQLSRSSDFVQVGVEGLGAEFSGYVQGQKAKAFLIGTINPFGKSVTVAALTSHDQYSEKHKQLAFEIVNSLAFAVPKESSQLTGDKGLRAIDLPTDIPAMIADRVIMIRPVATTDLTLRLVKQPISICAVITRLSTTQAIFLRSTVSGDLVTVDQEIARLEIG